MRALVRPSSGLERLAEIGVETVKGDVGDRRAVRRALRGVDRVFHLAGTTNLRLSRAEVFALNVEGTRTVLEVALRAGTERVVYTSSVAAVGPTRKGSVATETHRWDAARYGISYADAKHEAGAVALGLAGQGLPVVIVNPAHVLGAGDRGRSSTVLVRRFLRRQIPAYVDGTLNVVGAEDVARGHLLADERGVPGERYIPGAPVPNPAEVRAASLHWAFSSAKAKRELGWRTSPHEDCLEETIAWYRELDGSRLAPPGSRQPVALRMAGALVRRSPLGWR